MDIEIQSILQYDEYIHVIHSVHVSMMCPHMENLTITVMSLQLSVY